MVQTEHRRQYSKFPMTAPSEAVFVWYPQWAITSGASLGKHLGHIVNNGQQSVVLHASVMPFFILIIKGTLSHFIFSISFLLVFYHFLLPWFFCKLQIDFGWLPLIRELIENTKNTPKYSTHPYWWLPGWWPLFRQIGLFGEHCTGKYFDFQTYYIYSCLCLHTSILEMWEGSSPKHLC